MNVPKLAWFKFGESYSYDYGVWVEKLPDLSGAVRRSERIHIPGRGDVLQWQNDYANHVKVISCAVHHTVHIESIIAWLQGDARLILSNTPQYYHKAAMCNEGEPLRFVRAVGKAYRFIVTFDCEPHKYNVNEDDDALSLPSGLHHIQGKGTTEAEPIITIRADGNVTLTINGNIIQLNNIEGHITLDMAGQLAHRNGVAQSSRMIGRFCRLSHGENVISTTGNVQRIEINPSWRWL